MAKKKNEVIKRPRVSTVVKKKLVLAALEKSLGVVSVAAEATGVNRSMIQKWMKEDPIFYEQVTDVRELAIDFAESKLHKQIAEGNTTAIIFFLKCKGKKRGYIDRAELDIRADVNTKIEIVPFKNNNIDGANSDTSK